jgi:hypothetical protein
LPVVSASKATSRSKPSRKSGKYTDDAPKQRQFVRVSIIGVAAFMQVRFENRIEG